MSEYIVQSESLSTLADAIREKSGLTGELEFPEGFATAIQEIDTGNRVSLDYVKCAIIDYVDDLDLITIVDGTIYKTRRRIVS